MFGWAFPASFHPLRALLIYRNQPLKPTLTFDTIDRQRDRTKKLYRTLREPLGTAFDTIDRQRHRTKKLYRTLKEPLGSTTKPKHSSEQSKDHYRILKEKAYHYLHQKKIDEMGHLHLLLDEMGLDKMGLDEMGINLWIIRPNNNITVKQGHAFPR